MRSLVSYFGCGRYTARSNKPLGEYECTKLSDVSEKIIPFFIKHPIVGIKSLDFTDWCKAADIIKAKGHLTKEGLDQPGGVEQLKAVWIRGRSIKIFD